MFPRETRLLSTAWGLRLIFALSACFFSGWVNFGNLNYVVRADEAVRDAFLSVDVDRNAESRLTVVDIGEDALAEMGSWPWSRAQLANLVETLLIDFNVRAVALDVVLPEIGDPEGDARLAMLAVHAPVVLAQVLDYVPRTTLLAQGTLAGGDVVRKKHEFPRAFGYIANHVGLAGAPCVGNIGYTPDLDGVLRRIPIFTQYQERVYSHLSYALLNCASRSEKATIVPLEGMHKYWRIPYRYAPSSYTVISASDVLRKQAPVSLLKGRYVLVGSSALGLGDRVSTPLSSLSAGVMVHAASLSGLLDIEEGRTYRPWSARALVFGWTVVSVFFAAFLIPRRSAWTSVLVLLSLVLVWLVIAFLGAKNQAEGSIVAPLSAYFVLLVAAIPHEWWRSQRSAKRLLDTFSHYVAKPVLNELLRERATYSLEPTLRDVTVLIADMESYTRMTSSLSLEDAASLTKDFLDCLTRPVLAQHGTLDKYTGDGLVAFWGAPLPCPDQADQAVTAALAILNEVAALNNLRSSRGAEPVRVRIGIESGKALVGDLGTPFRSTYTAVGDCINFASRLERAARDLPVELVIGSGANRMLSAYKSIALGQHTLRGTDITIELFTVAAEN